MNIHSLNAFIDEMQKIARSSTKGGQSAAKEVKEHFTQPDWNKFTKNVRSEEYVKRLSKHPYANSKLITHAQSLHDLSKGKSVGRIQSHTQPNKSYSIKKIPGGLGCTCPDWRFKSSINPAHKCKHIVEHESTRVG